jgi:uncharacterized membrane protein
MENKLIKYFYQLYILNIIGVICLLIVIVLAIRFRDKLIDHLNNAYYTVCFCIFFLIVFETVLIIKLVPYIKDLENVQNFDFYTITGTVIDYAYIREGNDPADPIVGKPIIKDINSDLKVTLIVQGTKLYNRYSFIYLPHTRIAVIVTTTNCFV